MIYTFFKTDQHWTMFRAGHSISLLFLVSVPTQTSSDSYNVISCEWLQQVYDEGSLCSEVTV